MSENNPLPTTNTEREPDNIIEIQHNGTTYTIREFMDGKRSVTDIVGQRIMQDLAPSFPMQ